MRHRAPPRSTPHALPIPYVQGTWIGICRVHKMPLYGMTAVSLLTSRGMQVIPREAMRRGIGRCGYPARMPQDSAVT